MHTWWRPRRVPCSRKFPRRAGCSWVFASAKRESVTLDPDWHAIRRAAGLGGLRLHDLRHSHATVVVNGGLGFLIFAELLRHADVKMTHGYAHIAEGPVFAAADGVSGRLASMLEPGCNVHA